MFSRLVEFVLKTAVVVGGVCFCGQSIHPVVVDHRVKHDIPATTIVKIEAKGAVAPIKIDRPRLLPILRQEDSKYDCLGLTKHNGSGNCSITVIGPRASDGYYYALFSRHCCRSRTTGFSVTVAHLKDHPAEIYARWADADIALIRFKSDQDVPHALLSSSPPQKGDKVWHKGYGVNRPGNIESGKVLSVGSVSNAMSHTVLLSGGDSGSGLFLEGTMWLVGVNHSSDKYAYYATSHAQLLEMLKWAHPDGSLDNPPYIGYNPREDKKPSPPLEKRPCPGV